MQTSIFADYHPFCPPSVPRSNTFSSRDKNFIIVDSHYFMNHKKLLNVALRVGKGSMGLQGITELFHPWARKSFYWMHGRREKVFEKIQGIRPWYLQNAACTNFATVIVSVVASPEKGRVEEGGIRTIVQG